MKNKRRTVYFLLIVLLQFTVVFIMILNKERVLMTGKRVVFRVIPVDPRSLFRGDYVILNYSFSGLTRSLVSNAKTLQFKHRETVFVKLKKTAGKWEAMSISKSPFLDLTSQQIMLKGNINSIGTAMVGVVYGIESFFVPEGRGRKLESDLLQNRVTVAVSVDKVGAAVIRYILVDGRPVTFKK